ncbi:Vesicle-associated membrane protein 1 [Orchesella cincta]|uniref:Vesicle-associated membrane protein 1 n=1 Tax=Orchesella cincta TaxID=48709 RepID=A0A1D2MA93_ORCCI|nr:Vesicle-associated membrane protein 1 [Orchesella cincta]
MSAPGQPDLEAGPAEGGPEGEGEAPMPERKRTPQQIAAEQRLKHTQRQVDDVVDIMRTNVEKVLERDSKLAELDYRSDKLQEGASMFEKQAGALKNKFWLENMKMMIIMGILGLIGVVILYYKFFAE